MLSFKALPSKFGAESRRRVSLSCFLASLRMLLIMWREMPFLARRLSFVSKAAESVLAEGLGREVGVCHASGIGGISFAASGPSETPDFGSALVGKI
jgi:hypothetical protein